MSSIKVRSLRYVCRSSQLLQPLAWLFEKGKRANGRLPVSGEDNHSSPFTNEPLGGQAQAAGSGAMEVEDS